MHYIKVIFPTIRRQHGRRESWPPVLFEIQRQCRSRSRGSGNVPSITRMRQRPQAPLPVPRCPTRRKPLPSQHDAGESSDKLELTPIPVRPAMRFAWVIRCRGVLDPTAISLPTAPCARTWVARWRTTALAEASSVAVIFRYSTQRMAVRWCPGRRRKIFPKSSSNTTPRPAPSTPLVSMA